MAVTYQVTAPEASVLVFCLSTDIKPTANNDQWILWETDTGRRFRWQSSAWVGTSGAYADLTGLPATFSPATHTHAQSDVTNLVSDLSGKQDALVSGTTIKTVNNASLMGSGNLVVSGSVPDLVTTRNGTGSASQTVPSGYSAYVPGRYEIAAGQTLEIASGACMEIG